MTQRSQIRKQMYGIMYKPKNNLYERHFSTHERLNGMHESSLANY